ncbi:S8 family serine peptidase [Lysobacter xanthus]
MRAFLLAALALLGLSTPLQPLPAQGLGGALQGLPALPSAPLGIGRVLDAPPLRGVLEDVRRLQVQDLVRTERARVDVDARGAPVLRYEYLVVAPDAPLLAAVAGAGFDVVRHTDEGRELGLDIVVLHDRLRRDARRAMRDLQAAAPGAEFAYQHVYLPAGIATGPTDASPSAPSSARVGLIDGGVDASVPALAGVRVLRSGCEGRTVPQAHGTAVAVRLSGGTRDTLYAADLWCGDRVGRATLGLVEALSWMARERVPVINVSLVGPDNPVLARAVRAMVARGHVIVAAVGNDGPAAPPLYPAAYAGVIGVSGVDARLRVLPESASGPQVDFSAAGVVDGRLRGTSFAAPLVARVAARAVDAPSPDAAAAAQRALVAHSRDLGTPGRDPRYGDGFVAAF